MIYKVYEIDKIDKMLHRQKSSTKLRLLRLGLVDALNQEATQTVTISFNREDMACFDSQGAGCYVLEVVLTYRLASFRGPAGPQSL